MPEVANKTPVGQSEIMESAIKDDRSALLAQKTLVVSELAEAMSNQLNNIMMSVSSYAEVELKKAPPAGKRSLEQVLKSAARATFLIQKLLVFSRKHVRSPQRLALNQALADIVELLREWMGDRIEIAIDLDPEVGSVQSDPLDLDHALISLAISARNEMPEGGKLALASKLVKLDASAIGAGEKITAGDYVLLSAHYPRRPGASQTNSDQSIKIGLVLAGFRGIANEAEGFVRIADQPGKSTELSVYFRSLKKEAAVTQASLQPSNPASVGTILVVEDDDAVRIPAAEFLMMEGFKVLQARSGPEAIQITSRNRSTLDLLIADINMPEMSGHEVADQLLKNYPKLKVLYMSGDVAGKPASQNMLQKPFRLSKLRQTIDQVLGR